MNYTHKLSKEMKPIVKLRFQFLLLLIIIMGGYTLVCYLTSRADRIDQEIEELFEPKVEIPQ